ncbi:hypothetical protein GCM10022275_22710 [Tessaracoccus defluvii]
MMLLKFRHQLSFESVCREVADSISWQRFCRISFGSRVPHPTTLMKITSRCGDVAVTGLNQALLAKAVEAKLVKTDKVRADTTVVEADVSYPTDSGLLAKGVTRIAATIARVKAVGEAVSTIVRYARLHPTAIAQKVRVVIEHFRRNVMDMLGGEARAMVVTSSRVEALSWSKKMNDYLAVKGYDDMSTLVAFSGSLTDEDTGESITEVSLNGRSDVARAFREEDAYRVLIVANKFQTGFDEPRLMAMYVDKELSGVATVQTLSRLNRTYPGKTAPMVVDFRNSPASIEEDFKLYYSDAHVEGDVDPNALYTIGDRLDTADLYSRDEMDAVADAFLAEAGGESIAKVLSPIKNRWSGRLRQAVLSEEKTKRQELEYFRADVLGYRNAWQFLSQIVDYQDPDLHRRAILTTLLARNLHVDADEYDDSYL